MQINCYDRIKKHNKKKGKKKLHFEMKKTHNFFMKMKSKFYTKAYTMGSM